MRSQLNRLAPLAFLLLVGCVSLDKRAWTEDVDRKATVGLDGTFITHAIYRSKGEFLASDNLADALGLPARNADTVNVSFSRERGLSLQFKKGEAVLLTTTLRTEHGVHIAETGEIVVPSSIKCGGHDSPGFGCGSRRAMLYLNTRGELVCVESGSAVGVIGVIPMALYARLVSVYLRATGDPVIDNVPTIY